MLSTVDILTLLEEHGTFDLKQLAKKLEMPLEQLEELVRTLSEHELLDYNPKTGKLKLPPWLANINKQIEELKPSTGAIIVPRYQEITVQDVTVGNFTKNDLELKVRFGPRLKEIAICDVG
jgi:hypothetical protein